MIDSKEITHHTPSADTLPADFDSHFEGVLGKIFENLDDLEPSERVHLAEIKLSDPFRSNKQLLMRKLIKSFTALSGTTQFTDISDSSNSQQIENYLGMLEQDNQRQGFVAFLSTKYINGPETTIVYSMMGVDSEFLDELSEIKLEQLSRQAQTYIKKK